MTDVAVKYFPMWERYLQMLEDAELSDPQLGKRMWMMMKYQFRGQEPEAVPKGLRTIWTFIRKDLDDARHVYEVKSKNGRKGGLAKKNSSAGLVPNPDITEKKQEESKKKQDGSISMSMSRSMSTSMSRSRSTSTDRGSAPAAGAGVCEEKKSFGEFGWVRLTDGQYEKLADLMGYEELNRCITHIDELAQSTGNRRGWKDWYLLLRRCHNHRWHETGCRNQKPEIPKGASGVLGAIELAAIQKLMEEDIPQDISAPISS